MISLLGSLLCMCMKRHNNPKDHHLSNTHLQNVNTFLMLLPLADVECNICLCLQRWMEGSNVKLLCRMLQNAYWTLFIHYISTIKLCLGILAAGWFLFTLVLTSPSHYILIVTNKVYVKKYIYISFKFSSVSYQFWVTVTMAPGANVNPIIYSIITVAMDMTVKVMGFQAVIQNFGFTHGHSRIRSHTLPFTSELADKRSTRPQRLPGW